MSDLFGNHHVGFPTRLFIFNKLKTVYADDAKVQKIFHTGYLETSSVTGNN